MRNDVYELTLKQHILRGDTWDGIRFKITTPGRDYTGAVVRAQLRVAADAKVILEKNITPVTAVPGYIEFIIALTAAETSALSDANYRCDIQIALTSGAVYTPVLINFELIRDITI